MGLFRSSGKLLVSASRAIGKATGAILHGAHAVVARHERVIAKGAATAVDLAGTVVKVGGTAIAAGATKVAGELHDKASGSSNVAVKVAGHVAGAAADTVAFVGRGTAAAGKLTNRAAPVVGAAAAGAVVGTVQVASGAVDSLVISEADIDDMRRQLRAYGELAKARSDRKLANIEAARLGSRRAELLDLLVVGGVSLAAAVRSPADVPPEVEQAFQLAYPDLAMHETFSEAVSRMSPDELVGLANGVKGKLFEIELVDHLNDGGLPDGWHAELAHAANQPGWDLRIVDNHGQVADLVQAKATESAAYVKEALARYPDIDVTTTTEVHGQLLAMGMADHVHDGGITDAALDAKVETAQSMAGGHLDAGDFAPSALGLAVIGISVLMDKSLTLEQQGAQLGNRGAKAGVSAGLGKAAMVIGPYWWLGLVAGAGTRWLATLGGNKRERYEALSEALRAVKARQVSQPAANPPLLPAP